MKQTKEDRLISEAYNAVNRGGSAKKTVKMSYGAFLTQYKETLDKYIADFIDDDSENEDEAEQDAVDAVLDDLEREGIHIVFTDDTDSKVEDEETTELSNLHKMIMDRPNLKNIKIQTHNGNVELPIMEMWIQNNGIVISVDHSGLQTP